MRNARDVNISISHDVGYCLTSNHKLSFNNKKLSNLRPVFVDLKLSEFRFSYAISDGK